jgi:hypothetical protein
MLLVLIGDQPAITVLFSSSWQRATTLANEEMAITGVFLHFGQHW